MQNRLLFEIHPSRILPERIHKANRQKYAQIFFVFSCHVSVYIKTSYVFQGYCFV